ncbi:hypothetical protein J6590_051636 [Homalodisca vitripennis]|nr:hypothetical protein J6590_051636 [Homalodisca vitripennis]
MLSLLGSTKLEFCKNHYSSRRDGASERFQELTLPSAVSFIGFHLGGRVVDNFWKADYASSHRRSAPLDVVRLVAVSDRCNCARRIPRDRAHFPLSGEPSRVIA